MHAIPKASAEQPYGLRDFAVADLDRQHAFLPDETSEGLKDKTWNSGSTTRPTLRA